MINIARSENSEEYNEGLGASEVEKWKFGLSKHFLESGNEPIRKNMNHTGFLIDRVVEDRRVEIEDARPTRWIF